MWYLSKSNDSSYSPLALKSSPKSICRWTLKHYDPALVWSCRTLIFIVEWEAIIGTLAEDGGVGFLIPPAPESRHCRLLHWSIDLALKSNNVSNPTNAKRSFCRLWPERLLFDFIPGITKFQLIPRLRCIPRFVVFLDELMMALKPVLWTAINAKWWMSYGGTGWVFSKFIRVHEW